MKSYTLKNVVESALINDILKSFKFIMFWCLFVLIFIKLPFATVLNLIMQKRDTPYKNGNQYWLFN